MATEPQILLNCRNAPKSNGPHVLEIPSITLFLRAFCAFLRLKNPFNQRNPRLINYLRAHGIFTLVKMSLQIRLFMQNEPNFLDAQMNVTSLITVVYEDISNWTLGENEPKTNPIKANSKPIKANIMPKQTQYKAKQTQLKPISEAKKCCCQGNPPASRRAGTVAKIKFVTVLLTLPCIDGSLSPLKLKEADFWNYPG